MYVKTKIIKLFTVRENIIKRALLIFKPIILAQKFIFCSIIVDNLLIPYASKKIINYGINSIAINDKP